MWYKILIYFKLKKQHYCHVRHQIKYNSTTIDIIQQAINVASTRENEVWNSFDRVINFQKDSDSFLNFILDKRNTSI